MTSNSSGSGMLSRLIIIFIGCTLLYSLILMLGGSKIFKKAKLKSSLAFIPIVNLYTLLDVVDMSTFFGILYFVPIANIIIINIELFKLGKVFNTKLGYKLGLIFLPIIFIPLLAKSDKQYKVSDEEYFKAMDNAKGENINLMTNEEIKEINNIKDDEPVIDSIFKTDLQMMEEVAPYKAAKIDIIGMEKLRNASIEENIFTPIERIEKQLEVVPGGEDRKKEEKPEIKFTKELEKDEDVEFLDL